MDSAYIYANYYIADLVNKFAFVVACPSCAEAECEGRGYALPGGSIDKMGVGVAGYQQPRCDDNADEEKYMRLQAAWENELAAKNTLALPMSDGLAPSA